RWPGLSLPAQAVVECEIVGDTPFVLEIQPFISVVQSPLGLVANRRRDARSLVNRRIERSLIEAGSFVEALEEDHEGMWDAHEVTAQESAQVREVRLKRIKQRKRFGRTHP